MTLPELRGEQLQACSHLADCQKEGIKKYDPLLWVPQALKNKGKRIKALLTSTAHSSSSDRAFYCHTTDRCGEPSLITIISYILLCFLSFSGISNWKCMEIPTLETFCSYWCTNELTTLLLGSVIHLCALDCEFSLAFSVFNSCKIGVLEAQWY